MAGQIETRSSLYFSPSIVTTPQEGLIAEGAQSITPAGAWAARQRNARKFLWLEDPVRPPE